MLRFGIALLFTLVAACGSGASPPESGGPPTDSPQQQPADPTKPADPAKPGDPANPGDPAKPADPTKPADPSAGEPNDSSSTATALTLGALPVPGILATDSDVDFYAITTPGGAPSGYVKVDARAGVCVSFGVHAFVAPNDTKPLNDWKLSDLSPTDRSRLYFAAAPTTTYWLRVSKSAAFTGSCNYTLAATYVPIADAYEGSGNALITKNTPIKAYFTAGFTTPNPYDRGDNLRDAYDVDLAAGSFSVFLAPPYYSSQLNTCIFIFGGGLNLQHCGAPGENVSLGATAPSAGRYQVSIGWSGNVLSGLGVGLTSAPPTEFTTPYTMSVTQN